MKCVDGAQRNFAIVNTIIGAATQAPSRHWRRWRHWRQLILAPMENHFGAKVSPKINKGQVVSTSLHGNDIIFPYLGAKKLGIAIFLKHLFKEVSQTRNFVRNTERSEGGDYYAV